MGAAHRAKREFTESAERRRCRWCGRDLPARRGPGRRREFCRESCRQLDYQARRRAAGAGLGEDELIIRRAELDELYDKLYVLEAAIQDVQTDLPDARTIAEHQQALRHLLEAAQPVVRTRLGQT